MMVYYVLERWKSRKCYTQFVTVLSGVSLNISTL